MLFILIAVAVVAGLFFLAKLLPSQAEYRGKRGEQRNGGAPGFFRGTPLRPSIATHRTGKTTALIQRFCILCRRRKSDLTLHAALT